MRLSWTKRYAYASDAERRQSRLNELWRLVCGMDTQYIRQLNDPQLLDHLEQLDELMRHYLTAGDMPKLKEVMIRYQALLEACHARGIGGVEMAYFEMLFLWINGTLYRKHSQGRKAAEYYGKCIRCAEQCVGLLKEAQQLSSEQKLFVGWNCAECCKEAAELYDELLEPERCMSVLQQLVSLLQWLLRFTQANQSICESAAEMYVFAANIFYQNGEVSLGSRCYQNAALLLKELAIYRKDSHFGARAIWVQSVHGIMSLMKEGKADVLGQCEQQAAAFLARETAASEMDLAMVDAALANVLLQKSALFQRNGKVGESLQLTRDCGARLEKALGILQAVRASDRGGQYRFLTDVTARIYNSYIGAMSSMGVILYQNDAFGEAKGYLTKTLALMNDKSGAYPTGSLAALLRAEVHQYLGLIASDEGEYDEAVFYLTQAADMALSFGNGREDANALAIGAISCSVLSGLMLQMRNKADAGVYADKGLNACDRLERIAAGHPTLAVRQTLLHQKKKASRRFF